MSTKPPLDVIASHVDLITKLQENFRVLIASFLSFGVFMLVSFIKGFPQYIQIAASLGFSICVSVMIVALWDFCRIRWFRLHQLAGDEKETLHAFVESNQKTIHWFAGDDKPMSLAAEGIIVLVKKSAGSPDEGYAWYTIRPWIFKYLKNHKRLVQISK
jgi:hypothetical protein